MGGPRASTIRGMKRGQRCCVCGRFLGGPAWANLGPRHCEDCEPRPHRVVMTFGAYKGVWHVSFLAEDCQTTISRLYRLRSKEAVRELVLRTKPRPEVLEDFERSLRAWGQGSVVLQLTDGQRTAIAKC